MKTFDEAVKTIYEDNAALDVPDALSKVEAFNHKYGLTETIRGNEWMVHKITELTMILVDAIGPGADHIDLTGIQSIAAALFTMLEAGTAIGMEMEKQDIYANLETAP